MDITNALRDMKHVDFSKLEPRLRQSTADPDTAKAQHAQETAEFTEQHKLRIELHLAREEKHKDNCVKAAGLLLQQCSPTMKHKLQARPDYNDTDMDPVQLLQAIKEASMNCEADEYIHKTVQEALRGFVNLKQGKEESLNDYLDRFMTAKSVLWAHVGKDFTKLLQSDEECETVKDNADKMSKLKARAVESFLCYHFMANADQNKCGSLMESFKTQHNLKKNDPNADATKRCPASVDTVTTVFQAHAWDKAYHEKRRKEKTHKPKDSSKNKDDGNPSGAEEANKSFAQIGKGKCYCCGKSGHAFTDCPHKETTPKSKWFVNRNKEVQQYNEICKEIGTHLNTTSNASNASNTADSTSTLTQSTNSQQEDPWHGLHYFSGAQREVPMEDAILLDSGSSIDLFCREDWLTDVRKRPVTANIGTNAGSLTVNEEGDLSGYGTVPHAEDAVANILSLGMITDKHRVTMDSAVDNAFYVHISDTKKVRFARDDAKVHTFVPAKLGKKNPRIEPPRDRGVFVQTVEENKLFYTPREVARAKRARDLLAAVGSPSEIGRAHV